MLTLTKRRLLAQCSYDGFFKLICQVLCHYRRARPAERDKSATIKYLGIEHLRFNTCHAAEVLACFDAQWPDLKLAVACFGGT